MCRAVPCKTCELTTWAGCGAHVEQVLARVPPDQRCRCAPGERDPSGILDSLKSLFVRR